MARVSDLTPLRFALVIAGLAAVAVGLAMIHPMVGLAWIAVASSLAGLRHRKLLKQRRRRRNAPESKSAPHEEATSPQRRFDTTQINQSPMRGPVLGTDTEPIDWRSLRRRQESETGAALGSILDLARRALGCRTVALFLPSPDGSVMLRACSSDREGIHAGAKLMPGDGLLGTLLKPEASATLLEPSLPATTSDLGIYEDGAGPKSVAAVRVMITGKPALAMADHDQPLEHGVLAELAELASAADLLLSRTRDLRVEMRGREVWQKLGQFERTMGSVAKEEVAHEELRHFLLQFVGAEAVFFILPEPAAATSTGRSSERWYARVVWTLGADCDAAREFRVEVPGRGICAGAMARGEFLQRRMAPREQVPLLGHGEPVLPLDAGGDVLCAPVSLGVEGRPGMLVLYRSREAFAPVEREIVQTALSSFGQALTRLRGALELEKLATRDGLTGLLNHRTFQSSFRRELLKARRTGAKLALLLTDVDFFKKVNDQHGHPAGDAVLRGVAATVQNQLRDEVDIVARYGGEEFVCVLVGTTEQGALETAERIRKAVEDSPTDIGESEPKRVTISVGVSVFPDDGGMAEELIERTDQALYRAKHGGRNRVERALSPGRSTAT